MLPVFSRAQASFTSRKAPNVGKVIPQAEESAWLEPGHGWGVSRKALCEASELPEWYESYPYIRKFYRLNYNLCDCARSVVEVHNETCNIWSHLLGFGIFIYESGKSCRVLAIGGLSYEELSRLAFTMCAALMLGASATYHTFYPVSRRSLHALLTADKLGISLMLGGSYVPGVWLGFRNAPLAIRVAWLIDAAVITCIAANLAWKRSMKRFKAVVVCLIVSSLAPSFHWACTAPRPEINLFLPKLCTMFMFYGIGFAFYVTHWPERQHPGQVDILGASHQLWHICTLLAALVWLSNIDAYLAIIHTSSSSSYSEEKHAAMHRSANEYGRRGYKRRTAM